MLNFLDKNAPDILKDFIEYSKSLGHDPISLFKLDTRILAFYIITYISYTHKIDTYISKMGLVSIKVTYPNDINYNKEGITVLRKPIDFTNTTEITEYVKDLILYLTHNPY